MKVQTIKYSDKELLKKMDFIEYGWVDKNNKIYKDEDADKKNFLKIINCKLLMK